SAREGLREYPALREHLGRVDPDRALRSRIDRPTTPRRQGPSCRVRRWLHLGRIRLGMVRRTRWRPSPVTVGARRTSARRGRREGPPDLTPGPASSAAKTPPQSNLKASQAMLSQATLSQAMLPHAMLSHPMLYPEMPPQTTLSKASLCQW